MLFLVNASPVIFSVEEEVACVIKEAIVVWDVMSRHSQHVLGVPPRVKAMRGHRKPQYQNFVDIKG